MKSIIIEFTNIEYNFLLGSTSDNGNFEERKKKRFKKSFLHSYPSLIRNFEMKNYLHILLQVVSDIPYHCLFYET